jgi:putative transposase
MTKPDPFRYFETSREIIRLAVVMYVRFPLSLRNVEDLLHERGIDVSHEAVRYWWHRFGPMIASEIRKRRIASMKSSRWRWHLDEMFVKINGERHYLWRAVDHEGEVLESYVTYLSHSASFHAWEKIAPSKAGIKHLIFETYAPVLESMHRCRLHRRCT